MAISDAETIFQKDNMDTPLIVQICPSYVDLEREAGGVANVVRQICLHLTALGYRVLLICGNTELRNTVTQPGVEEISDRLTRIVVHQRRYPILGPTNELSDILEALPRECVAHVHTCFSAFSDLAMRRLSQRGIPYIFSPHGKLSKNMMGNYYWPKRLWWTLISRDGVRRATAIALMSHAEAELFKRLGLGDTYHVIPNGYQPPSVLSLSDVNRLIETPYVLFLGYIDPRKQPEFLVRAFAATRTRANHLLVFAGPDAYEHQQVVKKTGEECGVSDRVIFYGAAYGTEKWNLLRNAACLCLPSKAEGLPVVMCEALGAGLPTVYSAECNFPEVSVHGAGILVNDFLPSLWADAIDQICLNPGIGQRMQVCARALSADYTWENIVIKWRKLYDMTAKTPRQSQVP